MSNSLKRNLRKAHGLTGKYIANGGEQPVRIDDQGYDVLHPTRGWKRISYRRLAAQQRMATMLGGHGRAL